MKRDTEVKRDTDETNAFVVDKDKIAANIGRNLRLLCDAAHWSQAEFAKRTGISEPTLSNYIKGERPASVAYLANVCAIEDFSDMGLDLHIDDLIGGNFDPMYVVRRKKGASPETKKQLRRGDFVGTYLCYFFDQTKPLGGDSHNLPRELRYGVLSVYDDYNGVNGDVTARAIAAFYKADERERAQNFKRELDEVFERNVSVGERNEAVRRRFESESGLYDGAVEFSERHTFVNISSHVHGDSVLIVLYSPRKRTDSDFIGGLGSVASAAHGSIHMPVAQKIIISKYELGCSDELIAERLSMSYAAVSSNDESKELCRLCKKLYDPNDPAAEFLEESDKTAMVSNRMNQLMKKYIKKNACCVGTVSEEDDREVFELIKKYMD